MEKMSYMKKKITLFVFTDKNNSTTLTIHPPAILNKINGWKNKDPLIVDIITDYKFEIFNARLYPSIIHIASKRSDTEYAKLGPFEYKEDKNELAVSVGKKKIDTPLLIGTIDEILNPGELE